MISRITQIEEMLKNSNISEEAFELWQNNMVTKRLMLEIELDLLETLSLRVSGSVEQIAVQAVRNNEHADVLEEILDWIPNELKPE